MRCQPYAILLFDDDLNPKQWIGDQCDYGLTAGEYRARRIIAPFPLFHYCNISIKNIANTCLSKYHIFKDETI